MADRFDLDAIEADDALLDLLAAGGESARAAGEHDPALALLAELRLAVEVEDELPVESIDDPESFLARCAALNPITDPFARKVATRGLAFGVAAVAALSVSGVAAAVNGDPLSPYEKVIEKMVDAVRPQTSFPKEDLDGLPVVDRSKIVKVGKDFEKKAKAGELGTDDSSDGTTEPAQAQKAVVTPPALNVERPVVTNFVIPTEPAQTQEPTGTKTTEEPTGSKPTTTPDDSKTTETPPPTTPTEPPATTTTEPPATPTSDPTNTATTPPPADPSTPPATTDTGSDGGTSTDPSAGNPTTAPTGDPSGSTDGTGGTGTGVPAGGDTTAPTSGDTTTPAGDAGNTTGAGDAGNTTGAGDAGNTTGTTTPADDQKPADGATTVPATGNDLVNLVLDSVANQIVLPTPTGQPNVPASAEEYFGKPAAVQPDAPAKSASGRKGSKPKARTTKTSTKAGKHSSGEVSTGSVRKTYAKGKHSTGQYPEGKHAAIARTHGSTDDASLLTILGIVNAPIDPKK
ncbi:hypothetical protein [Kribbella jejuensis]|nr:hypothetical protein [Kribbella jejuensis]